MSPAREETCQLLRRVAEGDSQARDELFQVVYDELHRLASRHMRNEQSRNTLQPTALIHEAYLRLIGYRKQDWQNRSHFLAVASNQMRKILVDYAKKRNASKRGNGKRAQILDTIEEPIAVAILNPEVLLDLHRALLRLEEISPDSAEVIEKRFFGGLTEDETAMIMGTSESTVRRKWKFARAYLYRELTMEGGCLEPGPGETS